MDAYKKAGVDIDTGEEFVKIIKSICARTTVPSVINGIGGFAALTRFGNYVFAFSTDGVGTKLMVAPPETIGIDLVAMNVNDILVYGAKPLFFLDYYACSKLNLNFGKQIITGIANGCIEAGCALIGGETAEMPGLYENQEYDLAGFVVGIVDRSKLITGETVCEDDCIIGLTSSGIHSNGWSLARQIITDTTPTKIYVSTILNLLNKVPIKAMAHITGGGLVENTHRMFPDGYSAMINASSWPRPKLFNTLQNELEIDKMEMFRIFNCGIGFTIVVDSQHVKYILDNVEGSYFIGQVIPSKSLGKSETIITFI